jgi:predicted Na+-dependent transporter
LNFAVVPFADIVLVKSLPLAPETSTALLLLACTPGGVSALQFTTKIKGAAAYAGTSAGILSLLALLVSPLLLFAALPGISFIVPYGRALFLIVLFVLGPFAAGIWSREKPQERALKLSKFFVIAGTLAFVALIILWAGPRGQAKAMVEVSGILSLLGLVLIAMAAGWLMSDRARPERPILAIVTSMRNAALCLMIADEHDVNKRITEKAGEWGESQKALRSELEEGGGMARLRELLLAEKTLGYLVERK